jgi:hypothetical protein
MKKADPVSNLMLDVPDQAPPLGNFPYHGFWQEVYRQLPKALQERTGFSKYDLSAALNEVEQLANGVFRVIVSEKLWKVGQLLSLNHFVPANGQGGNTLGYIADSKDGGRVEIAAVCIEPIINSILQRASLSGKVGEEIGTLETEYRQKLELLRTVGQRTANLEQSYMPLQSLEASRTQYNAKQAAVNRLQAEIMYVSKSHKMAKKANNEISNIQRDLIQAEREQKSVIQQIEHWQAKLRNGEGTGNGALVANAGDRLTELGKANAQLARTIEGLGVKLMRLKTQDTTAPELKATLSSLQRALNIAIGELSETQRGFLDQEKQYTATEAGMEDARNATSKLSYDLEALAKKIAQIRQSQSIVAEESESEMIRLWVNHLSGAYRDVESYLFNNLRLAQAAAVSAKGGSIYMQKAISASRIAEMEQFLSAVDTVSDYLDNDEVKVLEQIARLGTVLNYMPGTARVMALRDMSYGQRKEAYRNMVEEMLELGERPTAAGGREATVMIGPIEFGKSEPLHEVASLIRHMTDTLLEG